MINFDPPQKRTAAVRKITRTTGLLTIHGELEPCPGEPNIGFLVRTTIPVGPPPVVAARCRYVGTMLRVRMLLKEYLGGEAA